MMLLVSQGLLWVVVIALSIAVLALARQVGVLHERIAPMGALTLGRGPQPGEVAPKLSAQTLAGTDLEVGGAQPAGHLQLLLFVAATCPVCKVLLPTAQVFAQDEGLDLLLVGDGDGAELGAMARRYRIDPARFINAPEVGMAYQVGKLPYAVLISEIGIIVAQGLVNNREHLESLVVSHESGVASVQEYLRRRRTSQADHAHR